MFVLSSSKRTKGDFDPSTQLNRKRKGHFESEKEIIDKSGTKFKTERFYTYMLKIGCMLMVTFFQVSCVCW